MSLPLLRQSIDSGLAGYEDPNDAERLCVDPTMRHVVGGRATRPGKFAASTREVGRFETQIISTSRYFTSVMDLSGRWIDKVHQRIPVKELKVGAADRVGSRFEVPRRLGVLAGAGKSLIDRSNGFTFVIGSVQQRPTKIHLGNVG